VSLGTGIRLADLIAAICFILALRGLTGPKTARYGNLLGAGGMTLAVAITFATNGLTHFLLIVGAMAIGAVIAVPAARLVKMTAMRRWSRLSTESGRCGRSDSPCNLPPGSGRLARRLPSRRSPVGRGHRLRLVLGQLHRLREAPRADHRQAITYSGQQVWNGIIAIAILGLGVTVCVSSFNWLVAIVLVLALAFGVAFVLPVGGADVPVLISLLNSFTGLAVAATASCCTRSCSSLPARS